MSNQSENPFLRYRIAYIYIPILFDQYPKLHVELSSEIIEDFLGHKRTVFVYWLIIGIASVGSVINDGYSVSFWNVQNNP